MATVTITGNTIRGATASKDNRTWQIRAVAYQYGGTGGGVITPGADWETLYPVDGVLTFTSEAGSVVDIKTPEGVPYRVRIPTGDAGLWDVIEAGVAYQPDVAQDALNRAVANAAPGFIAAELGLQTHDAVNADLADRHMTFTDLGDGEGYFSVGGVQVSGTLVPPAATWSGVAARPSHAADNAVRNGVGDDRDNLAEADDEALAFDGGGVPLMLRAGVHRVASNLTIDSPVWFLPGAILKPDNGVTVTLSKGVVNTALQQIFDQSAGGKCVPKNVSYLHPAWWGPTGTADDSQTWKDMLTACQAYSADHPYQQRILVPAGDNRLWQVTIRNFHVQGNGRSSRILPPATATAGDPTGADTGYMVRLRSTTTVDGVDFDTNGIGGIVAVFYTGSEGHMTNGRVLVSGENSIGVWCWVATGSITPKLTNVSVEGTIGEPFGVGIRISSYDFELTNCWIYYCTDGIQMTPGGSGVISGSHIWGCTNAGIYADYVYGVRLTNCYIENNEGWGAYFNAPSHLVIDNTTTFWKNGLSVPNTGGMRLSTNGAALSVGNRIDATFDDNYGTGLWLDWAKRTTGDIRVVSSRVSVQGHSDPLGTDGVYIGSDARDTDIRVRASFAAPVTGLVVNNQSGESAAIDQVSPVASTQMGGTGATNGANTWAKLATFTSAATFTNFIGMYAFTVNYAGTGECGILSVRLRNNATGADPSGSVQVLAMGGFIDPSVTKLTPESFKLINGALGEPFELWVQKSADYLDVKLRELTASDQGQWQVAYPRLSAWQSTTPTGTVGNRTSSLVQAPQSTTSTVSSGSGSVLILTITSTRVQVFTGSTSHRVRLPSVGVKAGMQYTIVNQSTGGTLAVESSDGTTVTTLTGAATPTANILVALRDAPTTNTHWRAV